MSSTPWFLLAGAVLIVVAVSARWIHRLPLSPAIAYLGVGLLAGPLGLGLLNVDVGRDVKVLEWITEVAVLLSLFGVGLRLQLAPGMPGWRTPVLLAGPAMVLTTALAAVAAHLLFGLPWAAAVLLAAVLSPTDPVLASDVQLQHSGDRDAVRLPITAEGGLNDGTAFPAVMLALTLLAVPGREEQSLLHWVAVDLVWACTAGVLLGWACGVGMGRLLAWLRRTGTSPQSEEFLVLGAIALTYGVAMWCKAYGFVAVFVAAVGLSDAERRELPDKHSSKDEESGNQFDEGDVTYSQQLLRFAGQCERLMEVVVVVIVGAALSQVRWHWTLFAYAAVLLLVVRPIAVRLVLHGRRVATAQRRLIAWFGIRGVGSVYYLTYALHHGAPGGALGAVIDTVLVTIATSIVLHGVSATPLMRWYGKHGERDQAAQAGRPAEGRA